MKCIALTALVVLIAASAYARESYKIDSRHTYPVFEINHLGFSTQRGRFNKASGTIVLDTAERQGSVEVTVETASIDMGLDEWDKHMRSDEWFDVEKFPTMSFKSRKLIFEGGRPVAAEGDFTLLGVTKPLRLTIAGFRCGPHPLNKKEVCGADVSTTIKRSEFGMTRSLPGIGDVVKINIPVEANRD